jgi:hypothetical protein
MRLGAGGRPLGLLCAAALALASVSACARAGGPLAPAAATQPPPTPGCPNMPWDGFRGLTDLATPAGLTLSRTPTGVRVSNATSSDWSVRGVWWSEQACFGWSEASSPSGADATETVAAGASVEVTVQDPGISGAAASRIGVEFWGRPCGPACSTAPDGFGWVDATAAGASN